MRILSYLDGELSAGERADLEAEAARDPKMAEAVASFRALAITLGELGSFQPSSDFGARVLASLHMRTSMWTRLRGWLPGARSPIPPNPLTAFLEQELSKRQARTLAALLSSNPEVEAAAIHWRKLFGKLERLPAFAPLTGFSQEVLARLKVVPPTRWHRLLARVRELRSRRLQWMAAASGAALAPTAVVSVAIYMVLSHPLVTLTGLGKFAWTKATAALAKLFGALVGSAAGSPAAQEVYRFVTGLASPRSTVATVVVLFGGLTLLSGWILYRNIVNDPGMDRQHVPV